MSNKKYLPVWTDGLTYDEQHLTFWIADNMEGINKKYSLLPIRLKGDNYCGRKEFDNYIHVIDNYFQEKKCRTKSKIMPLSYYIAEKAFDLAAKEFFNAHQNALNVTFHKLNDNGVYDTEFEVDYETRLMLFKSILDEKISEIGAIDEIFEFEQIEQVSHSPWPEYRINALLDIKEEEIYYNFPSIIKSYKYPYVPKKSVKVNIEDIYKYYLIIPKNIFILGNQHIKYNENAQTYSAFFQAAENRELDKIKDYVRDGVDINTIDSDGRTIFAKYIGDAFCIDEKKCAVEDLKVLMSLGASPSIFGAGFTDSPLSNVCLSDYIDIVTLLLESGVNPNLYPCIDEPEECMSETLLERTERWAVGDPNIDGTPNETQHIILNILKKHI
jgi:hypothetical protein